MLCGGFTKGAVGFALPMIAISGLGSFLPAHTALAALILPVLVTNFWQTFRQGVGAAWETLFEFRVLIAVLFVMIALTAQLVALMPERALFLILGVVITLFVGVQLTGWKPPSPDGARRPVEVGVGMLAGFCGGISGVWGPPILMYLIALDTPKAKQVRAQGVSFLVGSVILTAAHFRSGVLNADTTPLSLALVVPSLAGMALGFAVQDRLEQAAFRRLTLVVLCLAGLNLLRRGLF
jgi:hypothetical protein